MKYLKNHHYVLIAHIVISSVLLAFTFSLVSLISIVASVLYFMLIKFISRDRMVNYFFQLALFALIPFCYTTEDLVANFNTDWGSIITLLFIVIAFFVAYKIPKTRRESVLNVRNRYTEDDAEIRKKANLFVSKSLYVTLLPQLILTFYFSWKEKLGVTFLIIFLVFIIVKIYTAFIGHKKQVKLEQMSLWK